MGELIGHDGAPFLRRERDRSLSHRRLAQGLLSVMVVNVTQRMEFREWRAVPPVRPLTWQPQSEGVNHWGRRSSTPWHQCKLTTAASYRMSVQAPR